MGDHADDAIDQGFADEFENFNDDNPFDDPRPPTYRAATKFDVRCKRCGMKGLAWSNTIKGWRLIDKSNNLHFCSHSTTNESSWKKPESKHPQEKKKAHGVLEEIIRDVVMNDIEFSHHGQGCACIDRHVIKLQSLINESKIPSGALRNLKMILYRVAMSQSVN